jgi:prepilin-type N-terminal cleavage/methylation domain-containing protein
VAKKAFRGFSLVELVIVIVIIGIIAAIAIPRVSRGSRGAGESALASNLSILRNAIELYASEHDGTFPAANSDGTNAAGSEAAFENQLTQYTKLNGAVKATYDSVNGFVYGPYLRKGIPPAPVGAKKGESTVSIETLAATALTADDTTGWLYNSATGQILINSTDSDESGTTYDSY